MTGDRLAQLGARLNDRLAVVTATLTATRFRYRNELELHEGMTARLNEVGIPVAAADREVRLSAADRIDFLLPDGIGIEVKVDGQTGNVWRQMRRYAGHDRVAALVLVTTRARHAVDAPTRINAKMITVIVLRGGLR